MINQFNAFFLEFIHKLNSLARPLEAGSIIPFHSTTQFADLVCQKGSKKDLQEFSLNAEIFVLNQDKVSCSMVKMHF